MGKQMSESWEHCTECGSADVEIRLSLMLFARGFTLGKGFNIEDVVDDEPEINVVCSNCDTDLTLGIDEELLNRLTIAVIKHYESW